MSRWPYLCVTPAWFVQRGDTSGGRDEQWVDVDATVKPVARGKREGAIRPCARHEGRSFRLGAVARAQPPPKVQGSSAQELLAPEKGITVLIPGRDLTRESTSYGHLSVFLLTFSTKFTGTVSDHVVPSFFQNAGHRRGYDLRLERNAMKTGLVPMLA